MLLVCREGFEVLVDLGEGGVDGAAGGEDCVRGGGGEAHGGQGDVGVGRRVWVHCEWWGCCRSKAREEEERVKKQSAQRKSGLK